GGGRVDRIIDPSFIRNNLRPGTDLNDCVLLVTPSASVTKPLDVQCFPVGDLKVGEERNDKGKFFEKWYRKTTKLTVEEQADPEKTWLSAGQLPRLGASDGGLLKKWAGDTTIWGGQTDAEYRGPKSLSVPHTALLLLSLFDVYSPREAGGGGNILGRSGGHRL